MIRIKKILLEKQTNKQCIKNGSCLGIDTASRTGWAIAKVKKTYVELDFGFIKVDVKDHNTKFNIYIDFFVNIIENLSGSKNFSVVIEDSFHGKNAGTSKMLARLSMISYVVAKINKVPRSFIMPNTARAMLGLNGNAKKQDVHLQIKKELKIKVADEDILDAIVLALNGILTEKEGLDIC